MKPHLYRRRSSRQLMGAERGRVGFFKGVALGRSTTLTVNGHIAKKEHRLYVVCVGMDLGWVCVMVCICLSQGVPLLGSCGLVGVGVALLVWVWPCWRKCFTVGVGLKTLILAAWSQSSDEDVELSAPPVPCLPGCCHVPALMIMD